MYSSIREDKRTLPIRWVGVAKKLPLKYDMAFYLKLNYSDRLAHYW